MPGMMRRYAVDVNFITRSSRILQDSIGAPSSRREGSLEDIVLLLQERFACHKCQRGCSYCQDDRKCTSLSLCQVDFGNSVVTLRLSSTCYPFGRKSMDVIQLFDVTNTGSVNDRINLVLAASPEYLMFQDLPESAVATPLPTFQQRPLLDSLKCLAVTQTHASLPVLLFIGQLLKSSRSLERLVLSCMSKNPFADDVALFAPIAEGLSSLQSISHLQLEELELSDQALAMLLNSATTMTTTAMELLTTCPNTLDLRRNRAGPFTLRTIASILERQAPLHTLSLQHQLEPIDLSPLSPPVKNNTQLSTLILSGSQLKDSGLELLLTSLRQNTTLRVLRMDHCSVIHAPTNSMGGSTCSSLYALANGLPSMRGLTALDISGVSMAGNTFRLFAHALRYNSSLKQLWARDLQLDLSDDYNGAKTSSFEALFEALQFNTNLQLLDLSQNDMSTSGNYNSMSVLGNSLSINSALERLSLEGCQIASHGLKGLVRFLNRFRGLKELLLDKNKLDRRTLQEIVVAVRQNHVLTKLEIGHCVVDDDTNNSSSYYNVWTKCYKQGRRYPNEYEEILFQLKLNRRWRHLLKHSVPITLWPKLLESEWDPSIVYVLLREKILLCH